MSKPTTIAELTAGMTKKGGFTRETLESWGYSWPPKGGWLKALKREIRDRENPRPKTEPKPVVNYSPDLNQYSRSNATLFMNSNQWAMLRFDALQTQGRRCVSCGATDKHARLTVDHIIPLSKDWSRRADPTNLQIMCLLCNRGKMNRYSDDLREPEAASTTTGVNI